MRYFPCTTRHTVRGQGCVSSGSMQSPGITGHAPGYPFGGPGAGGPGVGEWGCGWGGWGATASMCHVQETQVCPSAAGRLGASCSNACTCHAAALFFFAWRQAVLQPHTRMEEGRPSKRRFPHCAPLVHRHLSGRCRPDAPLRSCVSASGTCSSTVPMCTSIKVARNRLT
jgi:hypothetical protein